MATARIRFVQGARVGEGGQPLVGELGQVVDIENAESHAVKSWQLDLTYSPPGSSLPMMCRIASGNSTAPKGRFVPDVPGSYRIVLKVWSRKDQRGEMASDVQVFAVPDPVHGFVRPPIQAVLGGRSAGLDGSGSSEISNAEL